MPYLFLPTLTPAPLRQEADDSVVATLTRKGWQETTPPTPEAGQTPQWDATAKDWVLVDEPPAQPDYAGLWDAILVSSVYQTKILPQGMASADVNAAATALGLAMILAVMGKPNDDAIRASIGLILATATLSEEDLEEIATMLAASHLEALMPQPAP
jgi:hypothetical protein